MIILRCKIRQSKNTNVNDDECCCPALDNATMSGLRLEVASRSTQSRRFSLNRVHKLLFMYFII